MLRHALCALLAIFVTSSIAVPLTPAPEKRMTDTDATKFFNAEGCKSCHAAGEYRVGPSYQMIAQRYPNATAETIERLSLKVLRGGAGAWGTTPMISHPQLSMEEAQRIVRWILANRDPG